MFEKLCDYISLIEKEYFGLRYIDEKDGQVTMETVMQCLNIHCGVAYSYMVNIKA